MRYWHPFTEEVLDELEKEQITKVILLPLYPQYSKATTESSVKEWKKQIALRPDKPKIEWSLIESYYDFPPYIDAFVERINQGFEHFISQFSRLFDQSRLRCLRFRAVGDFAVSKYLLAKFEKFERLLQPRR
jgi:protoheme ferro-lyase